MRDRSISDIATAAFGDLAAPEPVWLTGLARALEHRLGEGYGCAAASYGVDRRVLSFRALAAAGLPAGVDPVKVFEATTSASSDYTRQVYDTVTCETTSGIGPLCERLYQRGLDGAGIRDAVGINTGSGRPRGAAFLIQLPRRRRLRAGERAWLADVVAILRLSLDARALGSSNRPARRARRPVPVPIQRGQRGVRPVIVEPTPLDRLALLSARERMAILALDARTTNKDLAIALGTSPSTVGVLLHRASMKLKVRSRDELVSIACRARSRT